MKPSVAQMFEKFLASFMKEVETKTTLLNKLTWILETTGSADAADVKGSLDAELRMLFGNPSLYQELLGFEHTLDDPLQKREWTVLKNLLQQYQIPKELIQEIAEKEAQLSFLYASYRPLFLGKKVSDNDLREVLKKETDPHTRKEAWQATKSIGLYLAPSILELVALRNKAAKLLGYADFFQMQLAFQEIDAQWLEGILEDIADQSEDAYAKLVQEIEQHHMEQFHLPKKELGPWLWNDPFCQEDPLETKALDQAVQGIDILAQATQFYDALGFDVRPILQRSDMFERDGKNQHAFCIHIDKKGDIRTLNNVRSSIKWLETVLHEYGHAVYEMGLDPTLPWLLREPAHTFTTEAMALLAGRQAYLPKTLEMLTGKTILDGQSSLQRRQLIFSRWVLAITSFEKGLYQHPEQDLDLLWTTCVERYQKISFPKEKGYWAAKYHIGLAPVYYFSYLLGEIFASAIQKAIVQKTRQSHIATKEAGEFLAQKLFALGSRLKWDALVRNVTGEDLNPRAWLEEFCLGKQ